MSTEIMNNDVEKEKRIKKDKNPGEEDESERIKLTKTRFYILALYSLFSMEQCANWNTFGPIASSAEAVFCMKTTDIAMLGSIGLYGFLVAIVPATYLLYRSLRLSVVLGCLFISAGALLRCLPLLLPSLPLSTFVALSYISACLIALAGPIAMSASLTITAQWFPPRERITATSVGQLFNALGLGFSFILTFSLVSDIDGEVQMTNCTQEDLTFRDLQPRNQRDQMMNLMYVHAGFSVLLAIAALAHFPSQPKTPPSISSAVDRMDFIGGFKVLAKTRDAWFILITYAFPQCLIQLWQGMMVVNLTGLDLDYSEENPTNTDAEGALTEHWVNLLGIAICFSSVFSSMFFATLLSRAKKRMKLSIIILLVLASLLFILTTLLMEQAIPNVSAANFKLSLYLLLISGMSLSLTSSPITFELITETCFPVSEGIIGGWLTGWFNVLGTLFYLIFLIPGIGTRWLNYVLPISVLLPLPAILLVKENYARTRVDDDVRVQ